MQENHGAHLDNIIICGCHQINEQGQRKHMFLQQLYK